MAVLAPLQITASASTQINRSPTRPDRDDDVDTSIRNADPEAAVMDDQSSRLRTWQRYLILFIVSWNTLVITSTSTSLLIATPEIAATLQTTPQVLNATNAGVLLAMGWSSLIWGPVADLLGRRTSYNAAMAVLCAASIGTAVAPSLSVFTAMRLLGALTGTYFMVAGQTIIADIFDPLVRGRAVGCLMVGSVAGTALGMYIQT
jgi:MFS family permease